MKLTYKQTVEAQASLMELNKLNLPVGASIEIARLSNRIDAEVLIFAKTRDKLVKDYQIKPSHTEREDMLSFTCEAIGADSEETQKLKEQQLKEFVDKFHELLDGETSDLGEHKIQLPKDIVVKPKMLRAIADFIEVT